MPYNQKRNEDIWPWVLFAVFCLVIAALGVVTLFVALLPREFGQ